MQYIFQILFCFPMSYFGVILHLPVENINLATTETNVITYSNNQEQASVLKDGRSDAASTFKTASSFWAIAFGRNVKLSYVKIFLASHANLCSSQNCSKLNNMSSCSYKVRSGLGVI